MSLVRSLFACVRARRHRAGPARDSTADDSDQGMMSSPIDRHCQLSGQQQQQQQQQHQAAHQLLLQQSTSRLKFGVPLAEVCRVSGGSLPTPLCDLLVHVARDGVAVNDLFRRPGNPGDMKRIIRCLGEGRPIDWRDYNYWTAANVAKKFLLAIPDGVFGRDGEAALLAAIDQPDRAVRLKTMRDIIRGLSPPVRQLTSLLFGTWHRMCSASPEADGVPVEAVAKSVAGSMFHSCTDDPKKVEHAAKVMEALISGFTNPELFGEDLIRYFAVATATAVCDHEPAGLDLPTRVDCMSEPNQRYYRPHKPQPSPAPASVSSIARGRHHRHPQLSPPLSSDAVSVHSTLSDITGLQLLPMEPPEISVDAIHSRVAQVGSAAAEQRQGPNEVQQPRSISWRRTSEGVHLLPEHLLDVPPVDLQPDTVESDQQQPQLHRRTPSSRFNSVRRRQLERLARRTRWFLASSSSSSAAAAPGAVGESEVAAACQPEQPVESGVGLAAPIELQFSATSGPDLLESAGRPTDSEDADWLLAYKPD
ncbi:hypothetical protein BOX15_Mlig013813g2 [Macrostomum lignano]|uniref:Rho-GAP domain-containing protein n=1 Tax=Macrostomum lignano TaxID=282301 RepID=A0A267G3Y3_9PLAT|nr:hypothetical protein BOX15_Mlig013813g2 [Macrostomum lignano]